jgi:UDPglucose 6-dehydrogenase
LVALVGHKDFNNDSGSGFCEPKRLLGLIMNITVVGTGYVGLVAGACFAETGNDVLCVDKDISKIKKLEKAEIPIYEPGLGEIVERNIKEKRLSFTTSIEEGVKFGDVIFIAVGTPSSSDGSADLSGVMAVAEAIGKHMTGPKVVVNKSTVPVGTAAAVKAKIELHAKHAVAVVSNPEFLKEGAAIDDFMKPDRVVVGSSDPRATDVMKELYAPFVRNNNPILVMDPTSAEMTKYAANTALATRITLMNEIANLCEATGADIEFVRQGIGTDSRIGMSFLFPGIGYGGSCFPKDVRALINTASQFGVPMEVSTSVERVNERQKMSLVKKIEKHFGGADKIRGKHFALWGLAFKPQTDDVREAPALIVCNELLKLGATITGFDPEARETFKVALSEIQPNEAGITFADSNYEALKGADALVICTEWNEFRRPNFDKIKSLLKAPVVFDGRNLFALDKMKQHGFTYYSVGRPSIIRG